MARPAICTEIIPAACERVGVTLDQITENAQVRVSVNSIAELRAQVSAATDVFGAHATVGPFVRELAALFDESATEGDRAAAGLHLVTEADLLAEHAGRSRVGWVTVLPGEPGNPEAPAVLVTITTNSSIVKNLERLDGTEENAYQLLFTQSWRVIRNAYVARFVRDDRMARLLSVFALINQAIGERPGAWYSWGDELLDPSRDAWRGVIGAASSADDATRGKVKLLAGIVGQMRANIWPQDAKDLPLGLVQPTAVTPGGLVKEIDGPPQIDDEAAAMATTMLRSLARGATAKAVGTDAAVRGLRNGDGRLVVLKVAPLLSDGQVEQVRRDLMPALNENERPAVDAALDGHDHPSKPMLESARQAAIEAVRRVAQHTEFYRTGRYAWIVKASISGRLDYSGRKPTFPFDDDATIPPSIPTEQIVRVGDIPESHAWHRKSAQWQQQARRYGFFHQTFEWPSPVDLSESEWSELDKVLATHPTWGVRRSPQHRREMDRPCGPLSQLSWVVGDGEDAEAWSVTLDHSAYQFWRGPQPGKGQLWSEVRTRAVRVAARDLHRTLGQSLVDLGEAMDAAPDPIPVLLSSSRTSVPESPVDLAQGALDALRAEREKLEREAVGVERELADATPGSRSHTRKQRLLQQTDTRLDELDEEIPGAAAAVVDARSRPTPQPEAQAIDEELDVDANPLLVVGGALLRLADRDQRLGSPLLARALAWLLHDGDGLRLTVHDGRHVSVQVAVRVPGQDGLPAPLDAGQLQLDRTDQAPRGTSQVARTLHAEAPMRVLAEQDTSAFLQRTGWSLPFLVSQLRKWLHDRGVAPGAATALIDAALHEQPWPAPPIIYAYLTASSRDAADAAAEAAKRRGHAQLARPTVHAYIRRGADWPVRGTGFVRLPVGQLRQLLALLAAQPGAAAQRDALADELGIRKRHLYRLLSGADLMGVAPAGFDSRTAWLRRCTRKGCARFGQPVTDVVAVPETLLAPTPVAVVCHACRQLPGNGRYAVLPELYLRLWDADATRINVATGSHIIEASAPRSSWSQLHDRLSLNEAGRRLDLHATTVRKLITDGVLPAVAARNDRGGWVVLEHDLERPEVLRAARRLRRHKRAQQLTCRRCDTTWSRPPKAGRPPATCPDCRP